MDFKFITARKKHTGYKRCDHSGILTQYHPGKKKKGWWDSKYFYDCCNQCIGDAGNGCCTKWTCCSQRGEVKECTIPQNKRWTCCNKGWAWEGCKDIKKAEKLCRGCNQDKDAKGCYMIHECCGLSMDSKGCTHFYPCCGQEPKESGYTLKCVNCKRIWGAKARSKKFEERGCFQI